MGDTCPTCGRLYQERQPRPSEYGLTRRQRDLLGIIRNYIDAHGYPPSYDEMRVAVGLRSKSGIYRLVKGLVERGYLRSMPDRARSLVLLRAA